MALFWLRKALREKSPKSKETKEVESRGKVEAFLAEQALKDLKADFEKKRAARLSLPRPKKPRYQPPRPASYNPGEAWKCFKKVLFMIFEKLFF